jgi:ABC-type transport system involved in multi-copper enzyme maturation permease subunit
MQRLQPRKRDIVIWNTLALMGGLIGGDSGYVYSCLALFIAYTVGSFFYEFKTTKGSKWNYFIIGFFALFNFQFFGPIGLSLTIQSAINMYLMFMLVIPLGYKARAKRQATYSQQ